MSFNLEMYPDFPPEDWNWLNREAARRKILIMDVINDLMDVHMPNGFTIDRCMSQEEFTKHFEGLVLAMVHKARCQIQ